MTGRDGPEAIAPPHPRIASVLHGHEAAEQTLLAAYRGGRMPHAWLIGGPAGIGKATLAFRLARFVLAHPDPAAPEAQRATSLAVDPEHPVARRIAAQALGDLLAIERRINEKTGKLFQDIPVDDIRRTGSFFGSTASAGGWRVAVIDSVGELNAAGANALLKIVEEPPRCSLLLLISHSAARAPPTIRSRCRVLTLRPLDPPALVRATAAALGRDPADPELIAAASAAEGSVARAIALCGGPLLAVRERVNELLERVPTVDPRALHALADVLDRADRDAVEMFVETVRAWLSNELRRTPQVLGRLALLADIWSRLDTAAQDRETFNLDRRPLVFAVFGWLAEAAPR
jgi:DNA polymerase III subunit delta'